MGILWTIIIGFVARVIAKLLHHGDKYEPKGLILTRLGIIGAFVATYLGWYQAGEGRWFYWSNRWRDHGPRSGGHDRTSPSSVGMGFLHRLKSITNTSLRAAPSRP